jgi:hypothetical protein
MAARLPLESIKTRGRDMGKVLAFAVLENTTVNYQGLSQEMQGASESAPLSRSITFQGRIDIFVRYIKSCFSQRCQCLLEIKQVSLGRKFQNIKRAHGVQAMLVRHPTPFALVDKYCVGLQLFRQSDRLNLTRVEPNRG